MKYLLLFALFLLQPDVQAQVTSVAAHRGQASDAPENSLRGIEKLLPTGIKYIEIDVRTSKDGALVIMHDASLKRTTNSLAQVGELSFEELKKLKLTGGSNDDRIPSLAEVCGLLKNWNNTNPKHQVHLYVDCKAAQPEPLIATLQHYGLLEEAVFYAKDSYLLELRKLQPTIRIMPALKDPDVLERKVAELRPFAFDVFFPILSEELVRKIHRHGVQVFSDLLAIFDSEQTYERAKAMKVDVIQTDRAAEALLLLQAHVTP